MRIVSNRANSRHAGWTACLIAMATLVHGAHAQQASPAEPDVAAANQAIHSQLPYTDLNRLPRVEEAKKYLEHMAGRPP